jgi:hypothetical protein
VLVKLFFGEMGILKAVIVGIAGMFLNMLVSPILAGLIISFIPMGF